MIKLRSSRIDRIWVHPSARAVAMLAMLGVLTAGRNLAADEGDSAVDGAKMIEKIVADWKKRSRSIDSLTLIAEGTAFYKKGAFDRDRPEDYAGHYPAEDTVFDIRLEAYCDFKRSRIRFVKSYPVPVVVRPPMYFRFPRPTVNLYNGEKYFKWDEPLRNPDGTSELILITPKRSVRLMMGLEYDPIAFTTGNIPTNGVASSEPDRLRTTLSADRFRYLGTAFHDGRTVHRLGYYYRPKTHSELWVDVDRGSVVVRSSFVVEEQDIAVSTFDYEYDGDRWMIAEWSGHFEPGTPTIRFRVKKREINGGLPEQLFRPPSEPGIRVLDRSVEPMRWYRIDDNGKIVPDDQKQQKAQEEDVEGDRK